MNYIVHGILQVRVLEWIAVPFSRGSSQPRGWTQVSHIAGGFFTSWATKLNPWIPEWVAYPFSSRSSWPRNQTGVSWIAGRFFYQLSYQGRPKICDSHSVVSNSLPPHELYSPWNSPGQNMGMGSLSLLQWIFPTQGLNRGLLHCRWIFLPAEPKGKGLKAFVLSVFLWKETLPKF